MSIETAHLLPVICLDESNELNTSHPLPNMLDGRAYLLLGQVATEDIDSNELRPIHHYIVADISTGTILPGMFHGDRFRYVRDDDNFF